MLRKIVFIIEESRLMEYGESRAFWKSVAHCSLRISWETAGMERLTKRQIGVYYSFLSPKATVHHRFGARTKSWTSGPQLVRGADKI